MPNYLQTQTKGNPKILKSDYDFLLRRIKTPNYARRRIVKSPKPFSSNNLLVFDRIPSANKRSTGDGLGT